MSLHRGYKIKLPWEPSLNGRMCKIKFVRYIVNHKNFIQMCPRVILPTHDFTPTHINSTDFIILFTVWLLITTRLATINRSCISIYVTKVFGHGWGRGRPRKNLLSFSLITVQNLVAVILCRHMRDVPQNLEVLGPCCLGIGIMYETHHSHVTIPNLV